MPVTKDTQKLCRGLLKPAPRRFDVENTERLRVRDAASAPVGVLQMAIHPRDTELDIPRQGPGLFPGSVQGPVFPNKVRFDAVKRNAVSSRQNRDTDSDDKFRVKSLGAATFCLLQHLEKDSCHNGIFWKDVPPTVAELTSDHAIY
jgi:hypothetical protein